MQVHFKSERQDWQTPDRILDLVNSYRPIRLDPCTAIDNPVGADDFFIEADDGLSQDWEMCRGGLVYVNPPYGKEQKFWIEKCVNEYVKRPFLYEKEMGTEILLLVPARTDTVHWHHGIIAHADSICYIKGRLKFRGAVSGAPFPSALVYFGDRREQFKSHFEDLGHVELLG
jgi:site-specific DNA-methyltransferase (adenine-specific)